MSRVINTNNPGKSRNRCLRTVGELLRRLSQKPEIDAEARDMLAAIVLNLQEINQGVEQTAQAWEKRGYWMKSERFIRDWEWTKEAAANLDDVIRNEAWELAPQLMAELFPRFAEMQIKTFTRKPAEWRGAHARLLESPPLPLPY